MPRATLERLDALRELSRPLEPAADERAALSRAAFAHAESFLSWMETAPAYQPDLGSAAALANAPIGRQPIGIDRALELLARHVDRTGQNTTAAGFFSYIPVGNLYLGDIGEFLAAVSNRFSGRLPAGPGAVRIENQVLRWLLSVVGYPDTAVGNLLSGGSMANLSAIVIAREAAGLKARDVERSVVYLTEQAHHCLTKGLRIAGVGECIVRRIPIDERYRMVPEELDRAISEDVRAGRIPWLVVGTAGTTDTGAVDPLEAIAAIASRHRIWFHCDGAYGGPFALCAEGKRILRGIERSDSVALDPHKGLFVPFGVGALLVKSSEAARAPYAFQASYIPRGGETRQEPSPTDLSPELSRPFRALRLWLPLQVLGTAPFEAALEEKLLLARYAHTRLQELDGVEVGPEPDLSIVVFRALPKRGDPDEFNRRLIAAILEDGRVSLSPTTLKGVPYVRLAILAPRSHRESVDLAIQVIREKLRALREE
jgi:glutamate/tyrosine decarboxylase-like PLP-dependent enzyme